MRASFSIRQSYWLILGALILASLGQVGAEDKKDRSARRQSLAKPANPLDVSRGLIDAGQLVHGIRNEGMLGGQFFGRSLEYELALPGAWFQGYSYIYTLMMMLGVPEGPWTPRTGPDSLSQGPTVNVGGELGPRKGSRGQLFSGDVTIEQIITRGNIEGYPVMATSTLPETWPEGYSDGSGNWISTPGERHWPGPWAVDPGPDGIARNEDDSVLVGKFTGDKEVFFSMTDFDPYAQGVPYASRFGEGQGYPVSLQIDVHAIGYGRSYAEDFIFFPMRIINRGTDTLQGVYIGFYMDVDAPQNIGSSGDDWMEFIRSEEGIEYNMAFTYDPPYAFTALKLLETPISSHNIDLDGDARDDVKKGEELGITGWHWLKQMLGTVGDADDHQWEQYKVISGGSKATLWDVSDSAWGDFVVSQGVLIGADTLSDGTVRRLLPEHREAYFHPDSSGYPSSHFDRNVEITSDPHGMDCYWVMSSGPFTLRPGDTTTVSFALIMGEDGDDLKDNARTAQRMYDLNYLGPDAPSAPTVSAAPGDGRVTLYWDDAAEHSIDFFSRYEDFEGYKIYRTTSHPSNNRWGEEIVDANGKVVGFRPIAQFDLNNTIEGFDPEHPFLHRGSNTGLAHMFVDSTVTNGMTYWYAVCSYDRGINSENDPSLNPDIHVDLNYLECAKGNNPKLVPNLVEVTPGKKPVGYKPPEAGNLQPDPDSLGKGSIVPLLINPDLARETHTYTITFDDTTTPGALLYSVVDGVGTTLVDRSPQTAGSDAGPVFNGVRLLIEENTELRIRDKQWLSVTSDTSTYGFSDLIKSGTPKPADYIVHFYDRGDPSLVGMKVFSVTEGAGRSAAILDTALLITQESARYTFPLDEPGYIPPFFKWGFELSWETSHIPFDTVIVGGDTTIQYVTVRPKPPSPGDEFLYRTWKPMVSGDQFTLTVGGASQEETMTPQDLEQIRVVPNPYMVTAAWELSPTQKRLAFTNLPPTCTIEIFTVTGELVERIDRQDASEGWEWWDLLNSSNRMVSYGLYVYVVTAPGDARSIGKFAVIR
jgi:hypothetical protein